MKSLYLTRFILIILLLAFTACSGSGSGSGSSNIFYNVSFDTAGGTVVDKQTVKSGELASKPDDPEKAGFTFNGWFLNGVVYDFSSPVTGDIILLAEWEALNGDIYYTVSFDVDKGSAVPTQSIMRGLTATQPANPTKDGYSFDGWVLNGADYDFSAPVTRSILLVARWVSLGEPGVYYKVSFDTGRGSEVPAQHVKSGTQVLKPIENPVRNTYKFGKWLLKGKAYDFSTPVTEEITLTAHWEPVLYAAGKYEYGNGVFSADSKGEKHALVEMDSEYIEAVFRYGEKLYTIGSYSDYQDVNNKSRAALWVDGVRTELSDGSAHKSTDAVAVAGEKVCVAWSGNVTCIEGGMQTEYATGTTGGINALAMLGSNVYLGTSGGIWKNGTIIPVNMTPKI